MFLTGQLLVLVGGESQAQVDLPPLLLFPGVWLLQVPPATDTAGWDVLERNLHAPQQFVCRLASGGVQGLLDELPQSSSVLHLVDFVQFLVHALLGVEVPDIEPHAVLIHAVDVPESIDVRRLCLAEEGLTEQSPRSKRD